MTILEELLKKQDDLENEAKLLQMKQIGLQIEIELLKKQPDDQYTWEKCFSGNGFYINSGNSLIVSVNACSVNSNNINIARSQKHCKMMLATAQLSHIIAKANGDWIADWENDDQEKYCIVKFGSIFKIQSRCESWAYPAFKSKEIAEKVLQQSERLLKDFYMMD